MFTEDCTQPEKDDTEFQFWLELEPSVYSRKSSYRNFVKSPPCAQRYKKCKKKKNPRNDPYSILLLVEVNKIHSALKLQPRKIQENFHSWGVSN